MKQKTNIIFTSSEIFVENGMPPEYKPLYKNYFEPEHRMSWHEAKQICQLVGGVLPVLQSKTELDEIIGLFKLSKYMPPIETLFIGLVYNLNSKVLLAIFIRLYVSLLITQNVFLYLYLYYL